LNKDKGREGNKSYTKEWNNKKRDFAPKKEPHYLERYKGEIEVRNGDVGKALRILKRRLEKSDFQKELAKQQYYEKPSAKRNRKKKQAVKRWQKYVRDAEARGEMKQYLPTGTKWMKSKRKTRRVRDYNDKIAAMQRKRGF
jgi:small subunit ribosomal protein S21|tara:strand:+ start:13488 stop:13910 length:423 start_codon:yes stop_codon:yes gene_type:complete